MKTKNNAKNQTGLAPNDATTCRGRVIAVAESGELTVALRDDEPDGTACDVLESSPMSPAIYAVGDDKLSRKGVVSVIVDGPTRILLLATHTQAGVSAAERVARASQLAVIAETIRRRNAADSPDAVLLVGDLNVDGEGAPTDEYALLCHQMRAVGGLRDLWRQAWPDPTTHPGWTYDARDNELARWFDEAAYDDGVHGRLDYLFAAGLEARSFEIPRAVFQGDLSDRPGLATDLSDHLPLWAELEPTGRAR